METNVKSSEHIKHNLSTTAATNIHCCFRVASDETTSVVPFASPIFLLQDDGIRSVCSIYEDFFMHTNCGSQHMKSFFDRPCICLGFTAFILRFTTIVETTDNAIENMMQLK